MFDRIRFLWRAWSVYDEAVLAWKGGAMTTMMLVNLILSALAVGLGGYVTAVQTGAPVKAAAASAAWAALMALVQQLRQSPTELMPGKK